MRVLPQETGSVIFFLSDQPLINERLVRSLIDTHTATLSSIVAPIVEHQRSNPVLFDRSTFNDLLGLQGDMGGRVLFSRFPVNWLPWNDPRITLDIDTLQDYERLLSLGGDPKSLANQ
jgi:molybdenum cofactor cytidylyltransferase